VNADADFERKRAVVSFKKCTRCNSSRPASTARARGPIALPPRRKSPKTVAEKFVHDPAVVLDHRHRFGEKPVQQRTPSCGDTLHSAQ